MAEPLKIDAHMHMYRSQEHALMDNEVDPKIRTGG